MASTCAKIGNVFKALKIPKFMIRFKQSANTFFKTRATYFGIGCYVCQYIYGSLVTSAIYLHEPILIYKHILGPSTCTKLIGHVWRGFKWLRLICTVRGGAGAGEVKNSATSHSSFWEEIKMTPCCVKVWGAHKVKIDLRCANFKVWVELNGTIFEVYPFCEWCASPPSENSVASVYTKNKS